MGINLQNRTGDADTPGDGLALYSKANKLYTRDATGIVKEVGAAGVTSVGLTVPAWLAVGGSPITGAGTLAVTAAPSQTANHVLATPDGASGAVALRALTRSDMPYTAFGQVIYVSRQGNNAHSGRNPELSVLTIMQAITVANALTPATTNRITIAVVDAGQYSENVTLPDFVNLYAPFATLLGTIQINDNSVWLARIASTANSQVLVNRAGGTAPSYVQINAIDGSGHTGTVGVAVGSSSNVYVLANQLVAATAYTITGSGTLRLVCPDVQGSRVSEAICEFSNDVAKTALVKAGDGSATAPAVTFASDPDTGLWRDSSGVNMVKDGESAAHGQLRVQTDGVIARRQVAANTSSVLGVLEIFLDVAGSGSVLQNGGPSAAFLSEQNGTKERMAQIAATWKDAFERIAALEIRLRKTDGDGNANSLHTTFEPDGDLVIHNGNIVHGSSPVVGARRTGWGAPTGPATRTAFDTGTVTTAQLAERLKALIDDLTQHGLIGA